MTSIRSSKRLATTLAMFCVTMTIAANSTCGTTDYSGSSGRLYNMVVFVLAICSTTVHLLYAIAAVMSIYSATTIYIKMQTGEEGITKAMMILVGSCLFLIGATLVFPAFFGFNYGG